MEPSYDKVGQKGTIRVWNNTKGYLDVSEEGHLLLGETAAWVEETDEVASLIEAGLLQVLEGKFGAETSESPKKKKSSPSLTEPPLNLGTEGQVAVDENEKEAEEISPSNNDVSVETV